MVSGVAALEGKVQPVATVLMGRDGRGGKGTVGAGRGRMWTRGWVEVVVARQSLCSRGRVKLMYDGISSKLINVSLNEATERS